MTLGERIKKVRKANDLTQQLFAEKIGSTQNVLANYEAGRRNPSSSVINNICKTFNVHETWLRTGKGDMFAKTPNTAIEKLSEEFYLDSFDEALVEEYLHLTPNQRKTFRTFFYRVLKKSIGDSVPEDLLEVETGYPTPESVEAFGEEAKHLKEKDGVKKLIDGFSMNDSSGTSAAPALSKTTTSVSDTSGQERTEPDRPQSIEEEVRAEAEEYYRQRLMEKKQEAASLASQSDADSGIGKMA